MSEMKCPCCGKERERVPHYNKVVAWTCSKCCFTCNNEDLPRIAAAMELARLTVAMKTCRAYCPETAYLHAQDRVLEVFA